MKADFSKFLGPLPGDAEPYVEPASMKPLQPADPSTVTTIRHKLAIREAQMRAAERAEQEKAK